LNIPPAKSSTEKKNNHPLSESYQKYLNKEVAQYNSRDLVFYFSDAYKRAKGVPYFISIAQDSAKMHTLSSGLDNYTIVKLINYVVENKKEISIGMLCSSWVNSFIKEAGITHPEFTKYEVMIDSPFLTEDERRITNEFFDKMVWSFDNGDVHGEVHWKNKLEGVYEEIKRRRALLIIDVE